MVLESQTLRRRAVALLVLALTVFAVPRTADADLELGDLSFGRTRVKALKQVMPVRPSARFYMRVGGVSFKGVAESEGDWKVKGLQYDARSTDGARLRVTLANPRGTTRVVVASIQDWELGPIARYADSEYDACVTLFGEAATEEAQERLREQVEHVINYHPAFYGNLMGLRLLQADLIAFVPQATDLFKDDGRYLLGRGESAPSGRDLMRNRGRFAQVTEWIDAQPHRFTSYVLGDEGRRVTFGFSSPASSPGGPGVLNLKGKPIWDCWRRPSDFEERLARYNRYVELRNMAAKTLQRELERDQESMSARSFNAKWTDAYIESRFKAITGMDPISEESLVIRMPRYSAALTRKIEGAGGINPTVYQAVVKTMQYSAFFRHVKRERPAEWARFLASVKGLGQRAETPETMHKQTRTAHR